MLFVAVWAVVVVLLAIWSGLVWAAQALLAATLNHAGALGSGGAWALPESLAAWLPPAAAQWLGSVLEALLPQLQALTGVLPALSGGVTVLAWVAWGLGAMLLVGGGALAHVLLLMWRKSRGGGRGMPPLAAAMR